VYTFLLMFYSNYVPIFAPFLRHSEILVEIADLNLSYFYLAPPLCVTPSEFCHIFGTRTLEFLGYRTALCA